MRKMPRLTEGIRSHKVHSMNVTLGLLNSVCFQDLGSAQHHHNITKDLKKGETKVQKKRDRHKYYY